VDVLGSWYKSVNFGATAGAEQLAATDRGGGAPAREHAALEQERGAPGRSTESSRRDARFT